MLRRVLPLGGLFTRDFLLEDPAISRIDQHVIVLTPRATPADVLIEVADNGPGIDPGDLPFIFDRYYRVDSHRARSTGGAGLGLAITKWIVEAHGGTVVADSAPGRRTAFVIRLPLAAGT